MRHRVKGRKLSRTASHRRATMRALAMALIREHRIVTTVAKAKELRKFIEPVITRSKEDTHHNRRQAFSALQNKEAVTSLFNEIGPKVGDRPGGYTRVIKSGFRSGDGAEMAVIELVDFNDIAPEGKSSKKKKTRRAGKSNKPSAANKPESSKEETAEEQKKSEVKAEETVSEEEETVEETTAEAEAETEAVEESANDSAEEETDEEKK